jgi:hypothetical protein
VKSLLSIGLALLVSGSLVGAPESAFAASSGRSQHIQREVTEALAAHPGAKLVGANSVVFSSNHGMIFSDVRIRTAIQAQNSCPNGAHCWFDDAYYGGNIEWYTGGDEGCPSVSIFQQLRDKASSWWNNSSQAIVTEDWNGFGIYTLTPWNSDPWVGPNANDDNFYFCG